MGKINTRSKTIDRTPPKAVAQQKKATPKKVQNTPGFTPAFKQQIFRNVPGTKGKIQVGENPGVPAYIRHDLTDRTVKVKIEPGTEQPQQNQANIKPIDQGLIGELGQQNFIPVEPEIYPIFPTRPGNLGQIEPIDNYLQPRNDDDYFLHVLRDQKQLDQDGMRVELEGFESVPADEAPQEKPADPIGQELAQNIEKLENLQASLKDKNQEPLEQAPLLPEVLGSKRQRREGVNEEEISPPKTRRQTFTGIKTNEKFENNNKGDEADAVMENHPLKDILLLPVVNPDNPKKLKRTRDEAELEQPDLQELLRGQKRTKLNSGAAEEQTDMGRKFLTGVRKIGLPTGGGLVGGLVGLSQAETLQNTATFIVNTLFNTPTGHSLISQTYDTVMTHAPMISGIIGLAGGVYICQKLSERTATQF